MKKEVMFAKNETPLGIGQFGKVFSQYFENEKDKDIQGSSAYENYLVVIFGFLHQCDFSFYDKRQRSSIYAIAGLLTNYEYVTTYQTMVSNAFNSRNIKNSHFKINVKSLTKLYET